MKYLKLYEIQNSDQEDIKNKIFICIKSLIDRRFKKGDYVKVTGISSVGQRYSATIDSVLYISPLNNLEYNYSIYKKDFDKIFRYVPYKNFVSDFLLDIMPILEYVEDFDFIKEENDGEFISYLPRNRVNIPDRWNSTYRVKVRIGRFIKKIYPNYTDSQVEGLTNMIKSYIKYKLTDIKEVSGEKIRYWYNENHYAFENKGTLGNSCMRHSDYGYKFKIYVNNPDKCKLIILLNDKNKLLARALLWNTDKGPYMDRVYFTNDYEEKFFRKYANEKGYKNYYDYKKKMKVTDLVLPKDIDEPCDYPYMDTFKYIYYKKNMITNLELDKGKYIEADCYD